MQRLVSQLTFTLSAVLFVLLGVSGLIFLFLTNDWMIVCVVLAISFLAFLALARFIIRHYTEPLTETEMMIRQLRNDNYKMRTYVYGSESIGHLNYLLNDLADHLEGIRGSYETQQNQLETLIENIGSSFLFIDSDGRIRLANEIFESVFGLVSKEWEMKKFNEVLPYREVVDLILQSIVQEKECRKVIVLTIGIERKHFDVYCAPIQRGFKRSEGTVVVFHEITELKKLEQMRKDFVANVSHELRTPVTSLKGFSETLLDEETDADQELRKKFLTIINKESVRLEALIYDLLELSKIEGERFRLDWQLVNLSDIINDAMLVLQNKADAKDIQLRLEKDGTFEIIGDNYRIKQIFINVMDNAIAYSPEGSEVLVTLEDHGNTVEAVVTDHGIGMDTEQIPRVFERFYRVDKARSRVSGGTGLGLAIVKHLAEALGAGIEVNSRVGEGTAFKLIFHKKRAKE
ncbi:MAG TPA: ATP-binding protein [Bacillales bacterium]|nr:ATP-binding protein [Bacillales bacterium]